MSEERKYPSDYADRFQVRMPSGLRRRIAEVAESNSRSMNAEIVAALEEKYPAPIQSEEEIIRQNISLFYSKLLSALGDRANEIPYDIFHKLSELNLIIANNDDLPFEALEKFDEWIKDHPEPDPEVFKKIPR